MSIRRYVLVATLPITALLSVACSDATAPVPVGSIDVSPALSDILIGATVQLAATVRDAQGNALDRAVEWSSSNPGVATVSAAGLVTGVTAGTCVVTAAAEAKIGTATVTVLLPVSTVEVSPASALLDVGATLTLTATPKDAAGNPLSRDVEWSSSSPGIALVDAGGLVTGLPASSALEGT